MPTSRTTATGLRFKLAGDEINNMTYLPPPPSCGVVPTDGQPPTFHSYCTVHPLHAPRQDLQDKPTLITAVSSSPSNPTTTSPPANTRHVPEVHTMLYCGNFHVPDARYKQSHHGVLFFPVAIKTCHRRATADSAKNLQQGFHLAKLSK